MSIDPERGLRSLELVVRLRKLEETRALTRLASSRAAVEKKEERISELRDRRGEIIGDLDSQDNGNDSGGARVRQRMFLERLRYAEKEEEVQAVDLRRAWTTHQQGYEEARKRRRACESLRDRRADELTAEREARTEMIGEARNLMSREEVDR